MLGEIRNIVIESLEDADVALTFTNELAESMTGAMFTASGLRTALQQVETEYSIEDLDNRLNEALAILKASEDKNIKDFSECFEAAKQKVTEEDLQKLRELLKNLKYGMRGVRESVDARGELQQHLSQALGHGEALLVQL